MENKNNTEKEFRKALAKDLKRDEGFRSKPYHDSEGYLTIGYGTLLKKGISKEEAGLLLGCRMREILTELKARAPVQFNLLPRHVRRALGNMAYNLGVPRLLQFKCMWRALENEDFSKAADEALKSKWARQVGQRAERISTLIRGKKEKDNGFIE